MFFLDPQSVLLVVPRNIVTAVGLPLAGGFFSGSYTGKVVRGKWYNVKSSSLSFFVSRAESIQSLVFPPGRPAGNVFPVVWGTLYTGQSVSDLTTVDTLIHVLQSHGRRIVLRM